MKTIATLGAAALVLLAGCNKPSPSPEVATPAMETTDTVAAAGAPMADSVAVTDTAMADTTMTDAAAADTTLPDTTAN